MGKANKRLEHLIEEAKDIPEVLQDDSNVEDKFRVLPPIINRTKAFIKAQYGEDSEYLFRLGNIHFRPVGMTFNSGHYLNDEAWAKGRRNLLALLEEIRVDMMEKKARGGKMWNQGLFWTIILGASSLFFVVGYYLGNNLYNKDANDCYYEKKALELELEAVKSRLELMEQKVPVDSTLDGPK